MFSSSTGGGSGAVAAEGGVSSVLGSGAFETVGLTGSGISGVFSTLGATGTGAGTGLPSATGAGGGVVIFFASGAGTGAGGGTTGVRSGNGDGLAAGGKFLRTGGTPFRPVDCKGTAGGGILGVAGSSAGFNLPAN